MDTTKRIEILLHTFFCVSAVFLCLGVTKMQAQNAQGYILSSRFFHPRNIQDEASTLKAIQELNPKRIDWIYYDTDEALELYKKKGLPFSLTLNPQIPDSAGYTSVKFRIKDYNGNPYIAPWMKTWKIKNPYWGCVNNPSFYSLFLERSLFLASKGPHALMVDDAIFNARLSREKLVGCFCNYCMDEFGKQNQDFRNQSKFDRLKKNITIRMQGKAVLSKKDILNIKRYQNFQEQSVIDFFEKWKKEVKKSYPELIFLTNNYNGEWNTIYRVFDGGIAEIKPNLINKKDLDRLYHIADSLHKSQIFTIATEDSDLHIRLMEYNIKNKRESLLPWDIMIPEKNKRYYMPLDTLKKKMAELEKLKLLN